MRKQPYLERGDLALKPPPPPAPPAMKSPCDHCGQDAAIHHEIDCLRIRIVHLERALDDENRRAVKAEVQRDAAIKRADRKQAILSQIYLSPIGASMILEAQKAVENKSLA